MQEKRMVTREAFERRAVELYRVMTTIEIEAYALLPDEFKALAERIGYCNVCAIMVVRDLDRGRSERLVARKYELTRDQVRSIAGRRKRRSE